MGFNPYTKAPPMCFDSTTLPTPNHRPVLPKQLRLASGVASARLVARSRRALAISLPRNRKRLHAAWHPGPSLENRTTERAETDVEADVDFARARVPVFFSAKGGKVGVWAFLTLVTMTKTDLEFERIPVLQAVNSELYPCFLWFFGRVPLGSSPGHGHGITRSPSATPEITMEPSGTRDLGPCNSEAAAARHMGLRKQPAPGMEIGPLAVPRVGSVEPWGNFSHDTS